MSQNQSAIAWPSHITASEREFFDNFYQLLDGTTLEEGKAWSETFAPDGEFRAFGHVFKGHAAGRELIILTNYEMTCPDGSIIQDKSAAHFNLKKVSASQSREPSVNETKDPQVLTNTLAKSAL
ncbi:uncharacterized protein NECHADRAFT_82516 [Fusarium vanettenii 77-13-4]|uniref:Uncharacterized protein n=1 Tax=Fusarium vanettenii (strain ATCC MYA-4622 / CBS 123669 / FGSC 9596 / NRRL 45880 / 77-13-4) TaxID=660122 RepID=C7YXG0_FUSV7|nr:uncharacterized protein NECHADRAFT_82516 [Fusarium vanettenii 77-13-4]EEU43333.1 hypothetical protein NECHADRAFT_82516 [Fusarium vanettenii 77-13-4]